jgi:hypothetical protein
MNLTGLYNNCLTAFNIKSHPDEEGSQLPLNSSEARCTSGHCQKQCSSVSIFPLFARADTNQVVPLSCILGGATIRGTAGIEPA